MVKKIPPPPQLTGPEWQPFNRWLLELTSIIADGGGIDPSTVDGFAALQNQVNGNTADITTLQGSIAGLQNQINTLTNGLAAANSSITTLLARAQVFNGALGASGTPSNGLGAVNDWFANTNGNAGFRIFVKTAPTTWTAFPF